MYFVKITSGLITDSDEVTAGLLVDYSSSNAVVALDISVASKRLAGHLQGYAALGGQPLQLLQTSYDARRQLYTIDNGLRQSLSQIGVDSH